MISADPNVQTVHATDIANVRHKIGPILPTVKKRGCNEGDPIRREEEKDIRRGKER